MINKNSRRLFVEDEYDLYDVETNIKAARWLSFYDGWHHWNSSKHCWGKYARS